MLMADDAPLEIQLADNPLDDAEHEDGGGGEAERGDDRDDIRMHDRKDTGTPRHSSISRDASERLRVLAAFDRGSLYGEGPPFRFEWLSFTNGPLLALGTWCVAAAILTLGFWPRAPYVPPAPPPPVAASAASCGIVSTGGTAPEQSACLDLFVHEGVSYNACSTAKLDALSCESSSLASHLDACKPVSSPWCYTAQSTAAIVTRNDSAGRSRFGQCVDTCVQQPLRRQLFSELGSPSAVCMDGTSSGYYWAEATTQPEIYVLYLQGGNWCYDEASCADRCGARSGANCSNPLAGSSTWPEWRYVSAPATPPQHDFQGYYRNINESLLLFPGRRALIKLRRSLTLVWCPQSVPRVLHVGRPHGRRGRIQPHIWLAVQGTGRN